MAALGFREIRNQKTMQRIIKATQQPPVSQRRPYAGQTPEARAQVTTEGLLRVRVISWVHRALDLTEASAHLVQRMWVFIFM